MTLLNTYEADSLEIRVSVTADPDDLPLNLAGATVVTVVQRQGGVAFLATTTIEDAAGGVLLVEFTPDTFEPARYALQVRVTLGACTQTVLADSIRAFKSLRVA